MNNYIVFISPLFIIYCILLYFCSLCRRMRCLNFNSNCIRVAALSCTTPTGPLESGIRVRSHPESASSSCSSCAFHVPARFHPHTGTGTGTGTDTDTDTDRHRHTDRHALPKLEAAPSLCWCWCRCWCVVFSCASLTNNRLIE